MQLLSSELSLALALANSPGIYVPFLGSGVSSSANIPTGWDITLDLIKQISAASGEDCGSDPEKWFVAKFSTPPSYSTLLEALAKTPSERQGLLRKYFEPNEEEANRSEKLPTPTHKSIALLVKSGFIKLIVTTNFDRLMEKALEEVGVVPNVISNKDDILGSKPFHQTPCTIIKVHGDYLDTRIKNSHEELSGYETEMDQLLDRIFDEHGLIVCGWSATWDPSLRNAILRCKGHRYHTYWLKHGNLSNEANNVIANRQATTIEIAGADAFFKDLYQNIVSISESNRPHPLTVSTAVSTLKRLLPDSKNEIQIHDLLQSEINFILDQAIKHQLEGRNLTDKIKSYDELLEKLKALFIVGYQWEKGTYVSLWRHSLERLTKPLLEYPTILLMYSIGVTCTAKGKYNILGQTFKDLNCRVPNNYVGHVTTMAYPAEHAERLNAERSSAGKNKQHTPLSNHLFELLEKDLLSITISKEDFEQSFKEFEYIFGLISFQYSERGWGQPGRFTWQLRRWASDKTFFDQIFGIKKDLVVEELIKSGLFNGSKEKFNEVLQGYEELQKRISEKMY